MNASENRREATNYFSFAYPGEPMMGIHPFIDGDYRSTLQAWANVCEVRNHVLSQWATLPAELTIGVYRPPVSPGDWSKQVQVIGANL